MPASDNYLFEVSWEICNKVGGIYTVIRSKAREAIKAFGSNYFAIGPLMRRNPEFTPEEDEALAPALKALADRHIPARLGRWEIEGRPRCLLIDFRQAVPKQDELLFDLWEDYGVDSMFGSWDYIEPVLFSTACGIAIEEISKTLADKTEVYAHFHEWMSGGGLLHVKKHAPRVATVFTTHATILGRAMSGSGVDIYGRLDEIDPAPEAKRHNISAKYSMESVAAREADCFTAVSDITAREAGALLGTDPDVVTPNGFNLGDIPDLIREPGAHENARGRLLEFAGKFLERDFNPERTRIISISGRYEYHNKGIDILIESLARLNNELRHQASDLKVLCLFLVIGGNVGVPTETRVRLRHAMTGLEKFAEISTHHLGDAQHDPIVQHCQRANLLNAADDSCNVIFVPVLLDGRDGILDMEYYEALSGCDLGVYPSNYEPWGYTPLESIAYAVPAITTDKAGFGIWAQDQPANQADGVIVIKRFGKDNAYATDELTEVLRTCLHWNDDEFLRHRKAAREVASQAVWERFYSHYLEAYNKARFSQAIRLAGLREEAKEARTSFPGSNSAIPRFRAFSIISSLPDEIGRLRELAYNLWWVWNSGARELFSRLDPVMWNRLNHNPVALLEHIPAARLEEAVGNESYMSMYDAVLSKFDDYMAETRCHVSDCSALGPASPVAYFSMEFGLHESIPTYSGGLGVLSGDHLKSASDLNIPLVGISLLYKYGYFRQRINKNNEQVAEYIQNDFAQMPIDIVRHERGRKLVVAIDFPGRTVKCQVWKASVGRVSLYFLDPDIEENAIKDREISDRLYDSETRERVEQEMLLGIGGARLLHELKIEPALYHLNEGHSAFLLGERIISLIRAGLDFSTAREVVKGSTVFTTHTPVAAGNEKFDKALMSNYFRTYMEQAGVAWDSFWDLGHVNPGDDSPFDMTICALKQSAISNGVSRLHGEVARAMWQKLWTGFIPEEVPIMHITNGVHTLSWLADEMKNLLETFAGVNWDEIETDASRWQRIDDIPDTTFWRTHTSLKNRLFDRVKAVMQENWTREGDDPALWDRLLNRLDPNALTVGFARRFAPYKRPTLILKDIERIKAIVSNESCPVQFFFAGKAHPADKAGQALIRELVTLSKHEEFLGRILFLENYDINLARAMVAGVDVWLNNPVRPMEASGTSGMKASINGVMNCSVLDGWWDEAFEHSNGWAIGQGTVYENAETQTIVDSEHLYSLLEDTIIPLYYNRNGQEYPAEWVRMMKSSVRTVIPIFNTHRMLADYTRAMYVPTAERGIRLREDNYREARELGEWRKKLPSRFSTLHINDVRVKGLQGDTVSLGDKLTIRVTVNKGSMDPSEILAETVVQDISGCGDEPYCWTGEMKLAEAEDNLLTYETRFTAQHNGQFRYGVRIIPLHPQLDSKYGARMVVWS